MFPHERVDTDKKPLPQFNKLLITLITGITGDNIDFPFPHVDPF